MQQQFITFEVEKQLFGVDIMSIREIRAWTPTTRLPHVPEHVAGVVNLRGTVLPVFDLGVRFGWRQTEPTPRHVIVVTEIGNQHRGLIVDSVSDIVTISEDSLQPPPPTANDGLSQFLLGLVPIEERMLMVLDLARLTENGALREAA